MNILRAGLIGTGFMGKAHAVALHAAPTVFGLHTELVCELLADVTQERAREKAAELRFRRSTGDWRELVRDPDVDIVYICTPNHLHYEMAMAALANGKHVFCEKPLGLSLEQSNDMVLQAERAGVRTLVGFNYLKNPATALAAQVIARGEIGDILHFRGTHTEDYLASADKPWSWRLARATAGLGALGDLCHIISVAHFLAGDIVELCADLQIVIPERRDNDSGEVRAVENEDQAHMMVRFASGAIGTIECSRIAHGRKNGLTYEIVGTKGSLFLDQEDPGELQLFSPADHGTRQGFRRILIGPEHPDYAAFCPAAGHGIGFNDAVIVEVRDLVDSILQQRPAYPDFNAGREVDRVMAAAEQSWRQGRWVKLSEFPVPTKFNEEEGTA
ncbi:MAG: Gfo/Idh/MocA family oxidoreductase [Halioglobus sp.]|nr:Gfo/Idh/MocA family oxidoreductase [Halioglobus sp.]